jgi:DNA-binding GntR family transcriptional regulator
MLIFSQTRGKHEADRGIFHAIALFFFSANEGIGSGHYECDMSADAAGLSASPRPAPVSPRSPVSNSRLTQMAYEKILNAIVYGRLDLGEPLSENDLAKALDMSKAPIRQSLHELRLQGLVVVVPQSGTYVFSPTREEIEELCDFRLMLEQRAVAVSMKNAGPALLRSLKKILEKMKDAYHSADLFQSKLLDTDFHQTFLKHSQNRYLIQSYGNILHSVEALRYRFMDTAVYRNRAFDEHQKIVELLTAGDVPKVCEVLDDHISRTKHFQARVNWSSGRSQRKDYRFRDYSAIFAD